MADNVTESLCLMAASACHAALITGDHGSEWCVAGQYQYPERDGRRERLAVAVKDHPLE